MSLAAVVLAAGASSRLGQPKQLVRFAGERLLDRAIRVAHQAGASPVFVVLGAGYESMLAVLQQNPLQFRIVHNEQWSSGMASSVAAGAAAAEQAGAQQLLVLACDQPAVTAEHLQRLVQASTGGHVVASGYGNRRGIPALFPASAFAALRQLTGDTGARELLQMPGVLTVALPGGELDVDTPADLARLELPAREG